MALRFQITGTTEIAKALQGLPSRVGKEAAMAAMEKAVAPLVLEAKQQAIPSIRTGGLFRSIGFAIRQYKRGLVTFGVVGARRGFGVESDAHDTGKTEPANYAHLVEYGHAIEGDATGWVEAKPFMRPAWDATAPTVSKILGVEIFKEIEAAASKSRVRRRRAAVI